MKMHTVKAIIFDCDGTLVNSEAPTASLITEILKQNGHATTFDEILSISRGEKLTILADKLSKRFQGLDTALFLEAYNHEILGRLRTDLIPDPATIELISQLRLNKCVATNGSRQRTEIALEASGLLGYFQNRIVSAYDINAWKPNPEIILYSARILGVAPEECLLIDDSIDGLKAGLGAGAQVAAFRIPPEKLDGLKNKVAQINELPDLLHLL